MSHQQKKPSISPFHIAAFLTTLLVTAGLSFGFARAVQDSRGWQATSEAAIVNPTFVAQLGNKAVRRIPDFVLPDRFGNSVRLSDFKGVDLLVVNIWTTNCPVCEAELPSLEEMDRRLAAIGAVLVTVTINSQFDEVAHLFPQGTDLRILFDPDTAVSETLFGTSRFPETFILDKERRIRARFDGQRAWHSDEMLRYIATFR